MEVRHANRPGLQFYAEPLAGSEHETHPDHRPSRNELYVVCSDGSVQSVWDGDHPVGWFLAEAGDQWFYWAMRPGATPKPCLVRYHATSENPPKGRKVISKFYKGPVIIDHPICPGAPTKVREPADRANLDKIARNLDPQLAVVAAFLNDPVQTEALAKFAEGKMSYAEMRGLCG